MAEAVMRALECEHAHDSYHQARSGGQPGCQGQRRRGQDHQGPQQQRRRTEDGVAAYAVEGQQIQRFPVQTQSFQTQAPQTMEYQERPTCPHCQRRHGGVCRRIRRACFACGEPGHRAAVCPNQPQQPQYQPQYQQPRYQQQQPQYQQRPQQQYQRGLPAPPQQPLLPAPLPHPQGQQFRGDLQPRAQHGQFGQQGQRGQQRQAGLAAVDVVQMPVEDVRQIEDPIDEQMQAARPEHQGRMYAATAEEAVQDAGVITGTLLIFSAPAVVLFDSGSTHTFLARAFVDRMGMPMYDLGHDLVVSTPAGATLTTGVCVRGVPVVIQQRTLLTDFVVLPMGEFDAILGMDWMSRHGALIDCQKKKVQLRLARGERVTFQGRGRGSGDSLIVFQRARQLVERGCHAFLARIVATGAPPVPDTSDIQMEGDATLTTHTEATEMPPARETDFTVEVLPCSSTAAETPYQMLPFEFQELKSQLQEMCERGFVQPSDSPRDASVLVVRKKDGGIRVCVDYGFEPAHDSTFEQPTMSDSCRQRTTT